MLQEYKYNFITVWKLKAPLQDVWQLIYEQENWPGWWKGVLKVETIQEGDDNDIGKILSYSWRSALPYTLTFKMESKKIQRPFIMEGNAEGQLEGIGRWEFEESAGITTAKCFWSINTNIGWMNKMALLLRPFFVWNHSVIMRWGAKGMAKKLNAELLQY